ncbi:MAG TPA: ABC transporter permease subunit, partial [Pirellulales bacterium]
MYVLENPVLQRELLVNLRTLKAFVLLFAYIGLASAVVYFFWPEGETLNVLDVTKARRLFDLFFLGQFVMISLLTPAFAAGSMAGEKERGTFELLISSPLRPGAILLGKLLSSLCYIAVVIFSSLPIVMICLPLGGVNFYEVIAAYVILILSATTFGWLCLACSLYFARTA